MAPTGVAAENIGGRTIHSFFGFPPAANPVTRYLVDSPQGEVFRRTDILIVDEASMVSASLVDAMDKALRYLTRKDDIPLGRTKVVFVGDMGQLPPVNAKHFFEANAIDADRLNRRMLRLKTIFRQSETEFIEALLQVRRGPDSVSKQSALLLAGRYDPNPPPPSERTTLCPTNAEADQLNRQGLLELPGSPKDYDMSVSGNVTPSQMDDSKLPRILSLKIGARVIFLENKLPTYCNGIIGIVVGLGDNVVNVRLPSGDIVPVVRSQIDFKDTVIDDDGNIGVKIVGSIMQFPLRLAWGLTIHKGQGQTLDSRLCEFGELLCAWSSLYCS